MMHEELILKATDINWDIDIDEAYDALDEMTTFNAATALGIPVGVYASMTTSERHDYAHHLWHHCPAALEEFMSVPNEVVIPNPLHPDWDNETIGDYISDTTGWCHRGFKLVCNLSRTQLARLGNAEHILEILD